MENSGTSETDELSLSFPPLYLPGFLPVLAGGIPGFTAMRQRCGLFQWLSLLLFKKCLLIEQFMRTLLK